MTEPTDWTPEARKIREAEREGARKALRNLPPAVAEAHVDALCPAPPPEYTYGRQATFNKRLHRRRSDGTWEWWQPPSRIDGDWTTSGVTDQAVQALAAEVPLTDGQCEALLECNLARGLLWSDKSRERMRAAVQRVLHGKVK